jgi:putative heme-binding domain-containing protein
LQWSPEFARITWRLLPAAAVPALIERANASVLSDQQRRIAFDTLAFIGNKEAVMAIVAVAAKKDPALGAQANWWLLNRGLEQWEEFGVRELLKERGIYDPAKIVLQSITTPDPAAKSSLPAPAEIAKLPGDAAHGKVQAARCTTCHRLEGNGIAFGPDLTGWVKDQGVEAFFAAVLYPAQSIAHGFELTHLDLKGGDQIDGMVRSTGNPVMIESMGGVTQLVPRDRIQRMKESKTKSLMLSADQLGLTAQDLADLAAYLKTL